MKSYFCWLYHAPLAVLGVINRAEIVTETQPISLRVSKVSVGTPAAFFRRGLNSMPVEK